MCTASNLDAALRDAVLRQERPPDVPTTLEYVAVVPELFLDTTSFNEIQEAHVIRMAPEGAHILDGRILITKYSTGSYCQPSTVTRREPPPLMAAAVLMPDVRNAMNITDAHVDLGHIHERAVRETAEQ